MGYLNLFVFVGLAFCANIYAVEPVSPEDYLRKENYEIIEIKLPHSCREASINESGQAVFTFDGHGMGEKPFYFDPTTKKITYLTQVGSGAAMDINLDSAVEMAHLH